MNDAHRTKCPMRQDLLEFQRIFAENFLIPIHRRILEMIKPTVGRVIWYWHNVGHGRVCLDEDQPMAALVAYVHTRPEPRDNAPGYELVNLVVMDHEGNTSSALHVPIYDDVVPPDVDAGHYAEWMPYQVGQAKKTEELERRMDIAKEQGAPTPWPGASPNKANHEPSAAELGAAARAGGLVPGYMPPAEAMAAAARRAGEPPLVDIHKRTMATDEKFDEPEPGAPPLKGHAKPEEPKVEPAKPKGKHKG